MSTKEKFVVGARIGRKAHLGKRSKNSIEDSNNDPVNLGAKYDPLLGDFSPYNMPGGATKIGLGWGVGKFSGVLSIS